MQHFHTLAKVYELIQAQISRASSAQKTQNLCASPSERHSHALPRLPGDRKSGRARFFESVFAVQTEKSQHITVDSAEGETRCLTRLNRGARLPADECTFIQMLLIINEAVSVPHASSAALHRWNVRV